MADFADPEELEGDFQPPCLSLENKGRKNLLKPNATKRRAWESPLNVTLYPTVLSQIVPVYDLHLNGSFTGRGSNDLYLVDFGHSGKF